MTTLSTPHAGDSTRGASNNATRWDVATKRAPVVLAICGAVSIWAGPSLLLYEGQQINRRAIQENTVGIARLEERMDNVEAGLIRLEGKVDSLAEKVDQVLFILAGKDVAQP